VLFFNWAPGHGGCIHSLTSALVGGEWSASRPGRFTPREKTSGSHWIGGWVGPRAGLDAVVKRKIPSPRRESNPRTSIVQPVAQRYTDWAITALKIYRIATILPIAFYGYENLFLARRKCVEYGCLRRTCGARKSEKQGAGENRIMIFIICVIRIILLGWTNQGVEHEWDMYHTWGNEKYIWNSSRIFLDFDKVLW
jgi:hypothetical protein